MRSLNAEILMSIECPVCLEYMNAAIYLCKKGHSICQNCRTDLPFCPTCNNSFTGIRNYSLENVGKLLYYPCTNVEYGCTESFKTVDMEDHLMICSYRNYKCKYGTCTWEGRRFEIEAHFVADHLDQIIFGRETTSKWRSNKPKHEIKLLLAHGEQFFVHRKLINDTMYFLVQYIGKSEDVIQYSFKLHVFCNEFQHRNILISENCQDDLNDDITDIIGDGFAVAVPLSIFETFKDNKGLVWYSILIKKN